MQRTNRSIVALAVALALQLAAAAAFAQVQSVQVRKIARYTQTSATAVTQGSLPLPYSFSALVDGVGMSGIAPPGIAGPFNLAALGAAHNNGVMVYNPSDGGWRYGASGSDYRTPSQAALDSLFPNGTYTIAVNGVSVPLALTGDAYPNVPLMTLAGGTWTPDGKYQLDPSQALTITTSPFTAYGTHRQDVICVFVKGTGFLSPQTGALPSCPMQQQRASDVPGRNTMTVTIPPNSFAPGEEFSLNAAYVAIVDSRPLAALPNSVNTSRYQSSTGLTIKTTQPVFPMTVHADIGPTVSTATADIGFRPQDIGTQGSVYVFAMAPIDRVANPVVDKSLPVTWKARTMEKDTLAVQCVLAQLSSSGQLTGVSASTLQAYVSGVLSSQGVAVTILNGVPTVNIAGATFFVGYGSSGTSMLNSGINRSALTIPGAQVCQPQAPQTGWWWNPAEDGRGFSIEKHGNNVFFATFLYDASGRSTWYVSTGPSSLEGSLYAGDLLSARGGQTLGGTYPGFPTLATEGRVTLTFNSATNGTLVWPGGTVPIQRMSFVPNGLGLTEMSNQPESGWWWNEQEAGRGFFMEWQGPWLDIAGYMYDEQGNPVWYLTVDQMKGPASRSFSNSWWSFGNGQTLTGPWKPNARVNANVAPVTIEFTGADTAIMTLPNGRTTALKRHRF